jgi:glycosyltransferase involved in cell wall biosynthesis
MRLAVISHAYQDERYLTTLDAMARSGGDEVALIHPVRYKKAAYRWNQPHAIYDVPLSIALGARQGTFFYHPPALANAIDGLRPDVILHEQEVYTLGAAQIAAVANHKSIPLVQFVWENVDRALAIPRRLLRRAVLNRTTALIAGSEGAMRIHCGWGFKGPIAVIPQMSVDAARAFRFGARTDGPLRVCFIGRLVACKGVDSLLRAIKILHRRGFDVECVLAGEGPERSRLAALAHQLGIWSLVHLRGRLSGEGVRAVLRSSDVLVLPSRCTPVWEEQFGLVLAEAMAEGTIAVGSRTGAIPEVIGADDLLFDEDDSQQLVEILRRLAVDSEFYQRCRRNAWQRARAHFGVDGVADQKLCFLREVLDRVLATDKERDPIKRLLPAGTL